MKNTEIHLNFLATFTKYKKNSPIHDVSLTKSNHSLVLNLCGISASKIICSVDSKTTYIPITDTFNEKLKKIREGRKKGTPLGHKPHTREPEKQ